MASTQFLGDRAFGFEAKFVHDEELQFRIEARRDKLFAGWVATIAMLPPNRAHALRNDILAVRGGSEHDEAVLDIAISALARADKVAQRAILAEQFSYCEQTARAQILAQD